MFIILVNNADIKFTYPEKLVCVCVCVCVCARVYVQDTPFSEYGNILS